MFRSKSLKRKSKSDGLLNLALQDREWLIKTEKGEYNVDHDSKDILLPVKLTNTHSNKTYNKAMKILAVADAKYGTAPKMVGVKHLQPYYIDMAVQLSVYWYVNKKAFPQFDIQGVYNSILLGWTMTASVRLLLIWSRIIQH